MTYDLFPQCVAEAYDLVSYDHSNRWQAHLAVQQYQLAMLAAQVQQHLKGINPANVIGGPDCFVWNWDTNREPIGIMEAYARELYLQLKADGQSHTIAHVAIAALAQLSELTFGNNDLTWDLKDTGGYFMYTPKPKSEIPWVKSTPIHVTPGPPRPEPNKHMVESDVGSIYTVDAIADMWGLVEAQDQMVTHATLPARSKDHILNETNQVGLDLFWHAEVTWGDTDEIKLTGSNGTTLQTTWRRKPTKDAVVGAGTGTP